MPDVNDVARDYSNGDATVGDLEAAAAGSSGGLADRVLGLLTEYENSSWDETELRRRVAELIIR